MGVRRRAREQALQVLFGIEFSQMNHAVATRDFLKSFNEEGKEEPYLAQLVKGVSSFVEEMNQVIRKHSTNWRLERMAIVDKNILRIAAYELFYELDVPRKVAINEAIEIAKRFGSEDSPAFVNGVLDRIAEEARGAEECVEESPEEAGAEAT